MLKGGDVRGMWEGSVGIHGVVAGRIGYQWEEGGIQYIGEG